MWTTRAAAAAAVLLALAAGCGPDGDPPAPTARVDRGTVSATVSASGSVAGVVSGGFQVVALFEESAAARVRPRQPVRVSFDAVPGLVRNGEVLAVAPSGVAVSGVTQYYATIVSPESDPRLRHGQTARVVVSAGAVENVLRVPRAAVVLRGGRSSVNVPGPVQVPFEPGLVGDEFVEVRSGLRDGQEVLAP
ncbi:efflux RND transporter periplasmic adaptor subunit [Pseudonocardia acaciae]|uniref:efflux RND transporter periplasmic adaptor subunit n=1 Tax=Pseudonocardia acaciae TaxID=551276 RepID=UPI0012EE75E4|nr:efflux RND transporter periplasmic adaptor subunit [Pseudonocardia acaciae]